MPPDLDIETDRKLNGTMPAHSEHVIICTGQADWKSRIEDEKDTAPWGEVVSSIKSLLGPKGRMHDVSWARTHLVALLIRVDSHIGTLW